MTHSHTEFLEVSLSPGQLKVLTSHKLTFDFEGENKFVAFVTVFKHCEMQGVGRNIEILGRSNLAVGICWFNTESEIYLQHCVVVARGDSSGEHIEDAERIYNVFLVREVFIWRQYERIGLGRIIALHISRNK